MKQYYEALYLSYRPRTECSISQFFKTNCTQSIFRLIHCGLLAKPFKKFTKSPILPAGSHLWQVPNSQWTLLAELHVAAKCECRQSPIAKEIYPSLKIWSSRHHTLTACQPSVCTTGKPIFSFALSNYFESPGENWLHMNVVISNHG